jgi:hypothetical protein
VVGMLLFENAHHDPRHHMLNVLLAPGEGLLDFNPTQSPYVVHRPFRLSLGSPRRQGRHRLLSPEHVTRLVRDQDHANAINLTLCLGRLYPTAAHDAGPTSASVGLVDTTGDGEVSLHEPNM